MTHPRIALFLAAFILPLSFASRTQGQRAFEIGYQRPPVTYAREIAAVMARDCNGCHSDKNIFSIEDKDGPAGGLDTTTLAGLLRGGASGPAVQVGRPPGESRLFAYAAGGHQNHSAFDATPAIAQWIRDGASPGGYQWKQVRILFRHRDFKSIPNIYFSGASKASLHVSIVAPNGSVLRNGWIEADPRGDGWHPMLKLNKWPAGSDVFVEISHAIGSLEGSVIALSDADFGNDNTTFTLGHAIFPRQGTNDSAFASVWADCPTAIHAELRDGADRAVPVFGSGELPSGPAGLRQIEIPVAVPPSQKGKPISPYVMVDMSGDDCRSSLAIVGPMDVTPAQ